MKKSYDDLLMRKLSTPKKIRDYLNALIDDCYSDEELTEEEATGIIMDAIGRIIKHHGVLKIAENSKTKRDTIYKAFNKDGNPNFATLYKVTKALGLKIGFAA